MIVYFKLDTIYIIMINFCRIRYSITYSQTFFFCGNIFTTLHFYILFAVKIIVYYKSNITVKLNNKTISYYCVLLIFSKIVR